MKKVIFVLGSALLCSTSYSQTIGKTKTEDYKASFEIKKDITQFLDYDGPKKNIQLLKCGINDEMYEMYPELKEKRVGLGVTNIVLEYLDNLNRFEVTRIGLQVRFTNAETGAIIAASGLGEAKTTRELTFLSDATVDPVKFNQSTISISTKKALDIACANILDKMVKKGIFTK